MLTQETMRRVLQEHVDAENARDRERVLATYVEEGPEFDDVPTGRRFTGGDEIAGNTDSRAWCGASTAGPSARTRAPSN